MALAGVLGLLVVACGDSRREDIARRARAWVENTQDTTIADSAAVAKADSAWLDSLAPLAEDDWLYFWHEVASEKARRRAEEMGSDSS